MPTPIDGPAELVTPNLFDEAFDIPIRPDVVVYDNTLRDGEQTPGMSFSARDKLEIATALDDLGISWANVGFPAISRGEYEAVEGIVSAGLKMKLAALCRLSTKDIDLTVASGVDLLAVFIPSSDTHLKHKLQMTEAEAIDKVSKYVAYAKSSGKLVSFGVEDGSRSPMPRLIRIYQAAEAAGADYLVYSDTVGVLTPLRTYAIVRTLCSALTKPFGLHFHDDLGLAHANTLAGLQAGAYMGHVTVDNLGERAGNACLCEMAVTLRVLYGLDLGLDLSKLQALSETVHRITGTEPPVSKGVTGKWTFTHESGIHVAGVLADPETYQPYPPALIGRQHQLAFGKHSGKRGVQYLAEREGVELSDEACARLLARIKEQAKEVGGPVDDQLLIEWLRAEAGK
ncbi:MAG: homocitrate synthase [Haliangiales bacterium]